MLVLEHIFIVFETWDSRIQIKSIFDFVWNSYKFIAMKLLYGPFIPPELRVDFVFLVYQVSLVISITVFFGLFCYQLPDRNVSIRDYIG